MALPFQLVIVSGIKVLIVLLTIIVLILLDPTYITAYISVNYEIVLIYLFSSMTLLYCLVSIVMYAIMNRRDPDAPMTNCAMSEVVFAGAGMIGWMIVCGIAGTVAQRTIIDTGERFGWLGACAGIIVALFLGIAGLFCLNLINDKVLSPDRSSKYGSKYGARV